MNTPRLLRLHLRPQTLRTPHLTRTYHITTPRHIQLQSSDSLPKIAQTSFWSSLVPKFLRNRQSRKDKKDIKSKEWNPASFYIIIFILIGSQAIRMLALKHDFATYTRSTDAKISLLKEVIGKVGRGEKVDVEKMLGTGDEAKEREWEEVLRELEEEDSLWHKHASEAKAAQQSKPEPKSQPSADKEKDPVVPAEGNVDDKTAKTVGARKLNFY
ncbi:hypothetical protein PHISCL_09454 [Aspergillus sclerotialis]|uniref:Uncharacterized protein n=1 Tax=Aspergillus sclerotialis TaxID=2070753 RepID=A0A3A2Z570_9EURO|nr:hypothetical protein PHISCL_09454 [Aspergillus sclerotialis]